jgi:NADH-quinone oxidoreductase subunit C
LAEEKKTPAPKPAAPMESAPWDSDLTRDLQQQFGDRITEFSTYRDQDFLVVKPEAVAALIEYLKLEAGFDYLVDITAVHWPKREEPFDLIYVLYSFERNHRIRVKTRIVESYRPASVVAIHPGANWLEREAYDMFGIEFAGHPDLRRILLPEEWTGHPLRKDYSIIQMDQQWVKENIGIESGQ